MGSWTSVLQVGTKLTLACSTLSLHDHDHHPLLPALIMDSLKNEFAATSSSPVYVRETHEGERCLHRSTQRRAPTNPINPLRPNQKRSLISTPTYRPYEASDISPSLCQQCTFVLIELWSISSSVSKAATSHQPSLPPSLARALTTRYQTNGHLGSPSLASISVKLRRELLYLRLALLMEKCVPSGTRPGASGGYASS